MSKFSIVANDLRSGILSGSYVAGEKLPTIPELCHRFGVSKITIKRAMDDLEQEGLVVRRRGSGTYVSRVEAADPQRWADDLSLKYVVHDFVVDHPNECVSKTLMVAQDEFVFHICRTAFKNAAPQLVEHVYLPLALAPNLRAGDGRGSLHRYLEDEASTSIATVHQRATAVLPDALHAKLLGIDASTPVLRVFETYYASDGQAFMLSDAMHEPSFGLDTIRSK